jgi:hypothetical protein
MAPRKGGVAGRPSRPTLVADLSLDKAMLQDVVERKL